MITTAKRILSVVLLLLVAAAPLGCLNINKPPDNEPRTEVNVGGAHGVTVDH